MNNTARPQSDARQAQNNQPAPAPAQTQPHSTEGSRNPNNDGQHPATAHPVAGQNRAREERGNTAQGNNERRRNRQRTNQEQANQNGGAPQPAANPAREGQGNAAQGDNQDGNGAQRQQNQPNQQNGPNQPNQPNQPRNQQDPDPVEEAFNRPVTPPTAAEIDLAKSWNDLDLSKVHIAGLSYKKRNTIKPAVIQYMKSTGVELIRKFKLVADQEWLAFSGAICKVTYDLLQETARKLGIDDQRPQYLIARDNARITNIQNFRRSHNLVRQIGELLQTVRDIRGTNGVPANQTGANNEARVITQIIQLGNQVGLSTWQKITGDNTLTTIDTRGVNAILADNSNHLDRHIRWICERLDALGRENRSTKDITRLQETYDDDPRKGFKYAVLQVETPDCPLSTQATTTGPLHHEGVAPPPGFALN